MDILVPTVTTVAIFYTLRVGAMFSRPFHYFFYIKRWCVSEMVVAMATVVALFCHAILEALIKGLTSPNVWLKSPSTVGRTEMSGLMQITLVLTP